MKQLKYLFIVLAVVALALAAGSAFAALTMTDGNSSATIDESTYMWTWVVDGYNQLYEQDWWIRTNALGIDNYAVRLGDPSAFSSSWINLDAGTVKATFTGLTTGAFQGITATATYSLLGGSPGSKFADISEQLRLVNTSTSAKDLVIYEYNDFDLGGNIVDLGAMLVNANVITQWDETWQVHESTLHTADAWGIDYYANILNGLSGAPNYTLNNLTSPLGPGDLTFAWQWNEVLNGGGTVGISKDKILGPSTVPEPMSVLLGMMGLGSVAGFVRLRRK